MKNVQIARLIINFWQTHGISFHKISTAKYEGNLSVQWYNVHRKPILVTVSFDLVQM